MVLNLVNQAQIWTIFTRGPKITWIIQNWLPIPYISTPYESHENWIILYYIIILLHIQLLRVDFIVIIPPRCHSKYLSRCYALRKIKTLESTIGGVKSTLLVLCGSFFIKPFMITNWFSARFLLTTKYLVFTSIVDP